MAHPHKNRPRKGRRKIGSKKRKARRLKGKRKGKKGTGKGRTDAPASRARTRAEPSTDIDIAHNTASSSDGRPAPPDKYHTYR